MSFIGFGCHQSHGVVEGKSSDGKIKPKNKGESKRKEWECQILPEIVLDMYVCSEFSYFCVFWFFFFNNFIEL